MAVQRRTLVEEIVDLQSTLTELEQRAAAMSTAHPALAGDVGKFARRLRRLLNPPAAVAAPPGPDFEPHIVAVIDYLLEGLHPADVRGAPRFALDDIRRLLGVLLMHGEPMGQPRVREETLIPTGRLSSNCRYNVARILNSRAARSHPGQVEFRLTCDRGVVDDHSQLVYHLTHRRKPGVNQQAEDDEELTWFTVTTPQPIVDPNMTMEQYFTARVEDEEAFPDTPLVEGDQ